MNQGAIRFLTWVFQSNNDTPLRWRVLKSGTAVLASQCRDGSFGSKLRNSDRGLLPHSLPIIPGSSSQLICAFVISVSFSFEIFVGCTTDNKDAVVRCFYPTVFSFENSPVMWVIYHRFIVWYNSYHNKTRLKLNGRISNFDVLQQCNNADRLSFFVQRRSGQLLRRFSLTPKETQSHNPGVYDTGMIFNLELGD